MEAYVSVSEYMELSESRSIPEDEREKALAAAQRDIDSLTYDRIVRSGFAALTPFQQDLVKRAVCAQADFRWDYGEMLKSPLASYGINGVSMGFRDNAVRVRSGVSTNPQVEGLLQQTGLTFRGVRP